MWEADQVHDRTIVANVQALQERCLDKLQLLRAVIARLQPHVSARSRPRILGGCSAADEAALRCVQPHVVLPASFLSIACAVTL
jgi:hypothetical protein